MPSHLLWMLLLMGTTDPSTPATPPTPPAAAPAACAAPEYRQFDFWIGEWAVVGKAGKTVGHSRIESILGGCAIAEHWSSASGPASDGTSLNLYNASTKAWEQYWVDASGSRLHLRGGLQGAAMVLASSEGQERQRITWTPNADGSVRQLWESSSDAGASWTVAFDGLYRRAEAK